MRCTHGATNSPVNRDELFYCMARGLSRGEAERLIVRGFFQDMLDRIELEPVRDAVAQALEARIPAAEGAGAGAGSHPSPLDLRAARVAAGPGPHEMRPLQDAFGRDRPGPDRLDLLVRERRSEQGGILLLAAEERGDVAHPVVQIRPVRDAVARVDSSGASSARRSALSRCSSAAGMGRSRSRPSGRTRAGGSVIDMRCSVTTSSDTRAASAAIAPTSAS